MPAGADAEPEPESDRAPHDIAVAVAVDIAKPVAVSFAEPDARQARGTAVARAADGDHFGPDRGGDLAAVAVAPGRLGAGDYQPAVARGQIASSDAGGVLQR